MAKDVDWPGRGGTWLGVGSLIAVLIGLGVFGTYSYRHGLGEELLRGGGIAVSQSVQVDVIAGRVEEIEHVNVDFTTGDRRRVQTELAEYKTGIQGMEQGVHPPAPGTRYAAPLKLLYRQSDPSVALAVVDAEEWAADPITQRYGLALLVIGLGGLLWTPMVFSRAARRRGLPWWKWYSRGTQNSP